MDKKYDIAAYIWPAYTGDEPRTRMFWPEGMGEWQSVRDADKRFEGHTWPRRPLWGYVNEADPYVMEMQIEEALQPVPCKDYPVMLIRMKREEGSPTSGQIFFTTTEFQGPQENGSAVITYEDTTKWQDIIIDFSNNKNYKGELLNFRFDIANSSDGEYTYLIEYILFFGTEEAARNFDISTLPTPSPTPEPTDTPEQTQTPVPEKTKTPEKSEDNEKGISITTIIIIIAAVLFVVAAVIIFIPKKGEKENA